MKSGCMLGAPRTRFGSKAGFTLMEVALALAVVVVGILALFAMISGGLDASTRAVADTQAAMFADSVFGAIRARSLGAAASTNETWEGFWTSFAKGQQSVTVPCPDMWQMEGSSKVWVPQPNARLPGYPGYWDTVDGGTISVTNMASLIFLNVPAHDPAVTNIVNFALRYSLEAEPHEVQYQNPAGVWTSRYNVLLMVWDGEFGSTNDPLYFYTEFDNPGDL